MAENAKNLSATVTNQIFWQYKDRRFYVTDNISEIENVMGRIIFKLED